MPEDSHSTAKGMSLALLAYSSLSVGDAFAKSLAGRLSIFEIGFATAALGCLAIPLVKKPEDSWRDALIPRRPWAVLTRASTGVGAGGLGIFAITHVPLTQAYALVFMAPAFVALFARFVLRERIAARTWAAIAFGFLGMLAVVRPTVQPLQIGHLAAASVAVLIAASIIILRTIARHERPSAILGMQMSWSLLVYGAAALLAGDALWPTLGDLPQLAGAGGFAFAGQLALLAAVTVTPANRVAPAQYCQLAWAALIGALIFDEPLDGLTVLGLITIGGSGLLNLRSDR